VLYNLYHNLDRKSYLTIGRFIFKSRKIYCHTDHKYFELLCKLPGNFVDSTAMKNGLLNRIHKLQRPLSIILILHLSIIMLRLTIPFSADVTPKSTAEVQIIQQSAFGFNAGWIQTKQYSQDPVVKIGSFHQTTIATVSSSHIYVVFNDFPTEKTPAYQQHLIYTLLTSSDL
jgi:hypothetical protein